MLGEQKDRVSRATSVDEAISATHTPSHDKATTSDTRQSNIGPITRSRAKKLHQEVNSFLTESNICFDESFILPNGYTLMIIRLIHEENDVTLHGDGMQ